jgi:BASS family bile acid:Na+ symporter
MLMLRKICLFLALIALLVLVTGLSLQAPHLWKYAALGLAISTAIGIGALPALKGYQYTAWIITAVVAGMIFPASFQKWGDFDLRNKWLILIVIQLVMFGMGMHMRISDFTGISKTGKGITIGLLCHFTVMPIMGFILTKIFHFETEIAAGIILIGSCSSGLASNVMTYIAKGNLVLSVTVTAITTLFAPLMTPFLMKLLAGTLIEVKFINMMMEIIKIVIIPIMAALIHDYLKTASVKEAQKVKFLSIMAVLWLTAQSAGLWTIFSTYLSLPLLETVEILNFFAGAIIIGFAYHQLAYMFKNLDGMMPYISMAGIIYFTTVTTAAGRDNLMQVGLILFLVAVIHNAAGYFFGYVFSRLLGMDKPSARTIAFEVGLQNGGMASGLAGTMGKLGTVGLAAAVFSPWMNISGSILANYWRTKALKELKEEELVKELK